MAKRKRIDTMATPHMPSPKQRRKWAAESMAHTMMETDKGHKRMLDHISREVEKAAERAMRKKTA